MVIEMELDIVITKQKNPNWSHGKLAKRFGCSPSHVQTVLAKSKFDGRIKNLYDSLLSKISNTQETKFKIIGETLRAVEWELKVLEIKNKIKLTQIGDIDQGYYYICEIL